MKINLREALDNVVNDAFPKGWAYGQFDVVLPSLETLGDTLYIPKTIKAKDVHTEKEPIKYYIKDYKGVEFYIYGNYYDFTPGDDVSFFLKPYKSLHGLDKKTSESYFIRYKIVKTYPLEMYNFLNGL